MASFLLAAAALAPLGFAHNDATPWLLNGQNGRVMPNDGWNGPTGMYVFGSGALLGGDLVAPNGYETWVGVAKLTCDLEVLSPGDGTADPLDEPEVDGVANAPSLAGVTLFNDGGLGGVCHTPAGYYANAGYNTPGCGATYTGKAMAQDLVASDVWIMTVCAFGHAVFGGVGMTQGGVGCEEGAARTLSVPKAAGCLLPVAACWLVVVCAIGATAFACGPDAGGAYDLFTPGISAWGSQGAPFEDVPLGWLACSDDDGVAMVVVWPAVFLDAVHAPLPVAAAVSTPTVGIILADGHGAIADGGGGDPT